MSLPPESTLEDVKVRIRESVNNPNVGKIEQVVLKEELTQGVRLIFLRLEVYAAPSCDHVLFRHFAAFFLLWPIK